MVFVSYPKDKTFEYAFAGSWGNTNKKFHYTLNKKELFHSQKLIAPLVLENHADFLCKQSLAHFLHIKYRVLLNTLSLFLK
tara:strand:+ start:1480 stop:1722 length:243 start_codon:yes stop_codon:yes gene_type:complete